MRLIDAEVFRSILSDALNKPGVTSPIIRSLMRTIIYSLDAMPTVDAVPVCRCKDCKHRPIKPDDYNPITTDGFALEFPDEKCPCQCGDGWYSKYPDDDWYCPIGERKGGGE